MAVADATLIHDVTLTIRDAISSNVTDPIASSRSSTSKFVATGFPQRPAEYPLITIEVIDTSDRNLGMRSEASEVKITLEIQIWAKRPRQRDELWDSVYNFLRTYQLGTGETIATGLFNFKILSAVNIDEEGKQGLHRKAVRIQYDYLTST